MPVIDNSQTLFPGAATIPAAAPAVATAVPAPIAPTKKGRTLTPAEQAYRVHNQQIWAARHKGDPRAVGAAPAPVAPAPVNGGGIATTMPVLPSTVNPALVAGQRQFLTGAPAAPASGAMPATGMRALMSSAGGKSGLLNQGGAVGPVADTLATLHGNQL